MSSFVWLCNVYACVYAWEKISWLYFMLWQAIWVNDVKTSAKAVLLSVSVSMTHMHYIFVDEIMYKWFLIGN